MEIEWVDELPEHVRFKHENKRGKYVALALGLQENPGRWATFPAAAASTDSSAAGLAQNINRGKLSGFGAGKYEAIADGTKVYVRFKPPADPEAQQNGNGSDDDPPDPSDDDIDPREVREWARKNGWPSLSDRGRLSGDILEAYKARES